MGLLLRLATYPQVGCVIAWPTHAVRVLGHPAPFRSSSGQFIFQGHRRHGEPFTLASVLSDPCVDVPSMDEYPIVLFDDQTAWREWLDHHHESERGVWLRLAKAASSLRSVSHAEALDVALCYGWIDGQTRKYDEDSWLQKFTPRSKRSTWSKRNREHVERLTAERQMRPAGLAAVEVAKNDGRWDRAYDSPAAATVPDDLAVALERSPEAKTFFATLSSANRFAILYRIQTAVRPETRARRIERFVGMLERGETLHP